MSTTMQLPLAFGYSVSDEWDEDNGYESYFVFTINSMEVYREKTRYGATPEEALEWVRGLAFKVLDMDWSKALDSPTR